MITFTKKAGKDFVILNLTDPQLASREWATPVGELLKRTVKELICRSKPDLITVSGDMSYGGEFEAYGHFRDMMDGFGIPWAVVFGNHDNQAGQDKVSTAVDIMAKSPLFTFERGDEEMGIGNYMISVEQDGVPVETVFMMDTHDRFPVYDKDENQSDEGWGKLLPNQLAWYKENAEAQKKRGNRDSTLITHIPIYAYRDAFCTAFSGVCDDKEIDLNDSANPKYWNEGYRDSYGIKREGIGSYPEDEGMFDVIKEVGTTKTIITGHDHINNYVIKYEGVTFVYALKTGMGCYWAEDMNGGTFITVGDDGVKEIRHEYVKP